jgi:hypothetical protein
LAAAVSQVPRVAARGGSAADQVWAFHARQACWDVPAEPVAYGSAAHDSAARLALPAHSAVQRVRWVGRPVSRPVCWDDPVHSAGPLVRARLDEHQVGLAARPAADVRQRVPAAFPRGLRGS